MLFAILDDALMGANEAWATDIRHTRHIGDSTGWTEHGRHMKSFERLLRDLKQPGDKGRGAARAVVAAATLSCTSVPD